MVRRPPRRIDQRRGSTDAQRDCRWHYLDKFRHGKSECGDRDGSTKRHFPKSRSVSWQMWRSETATKKLRAKRRKQLASVKTKKVAYGLKKKPVNVQKRKHVN